MEIGFGLPLHHPSHSLHPYFLGHDRSPDLRGGLQQVRRPQPGSPRGPLRHQGRQIIRPARRGEEQVLLHQRLHLQEVHQGRADHGLPEPRHAVTCLCLNPYHRGLWLQHHHLLKRNRAHRRRFEHAYLLCHADHDGRHAREHGLRHDHRLEELGRTYRGRPPRGPGFGQPREPGIRGQRQLRLLQGRELPL